MNLCKKADAISCLSYFSTTLKLEAMLVLCRAHLSARAGLAREEHAVFCRYSDLVLAVATTSEMFCTACGHMNAGEGKEKDLSSRNGCKLCNTNIRSPNPNCIHVYCSVQVQ